MNATRGAPSIATIARRLDAIALQQLRDECARLAAENDRLRHQLATAEDDIDAWCTNALRLQQALCSRTGNHPAITQAGDLVVVDGPDDDVGGAG